MTDYKSVLTPFSSQFSTHRRVEKKNYRVNEIRTGLQCPKLRLDHPSHCHHGYGLQEKKKKKKGRSQHEVNL